MKRAPARKTIRILEVIDKSFLGGGQKTVLLLAKGLDRSLFEVLVCSDDEGPLVRELGRLGIRHVPIRLGKRPGLGPVREIRRLIRERAIDIVHTHGGVAGLYGRLAARGTQAGTVHTLHGIHYLHYRNPFLRKAFILLERWMSRSTGSVVCVSHADRERAAALRLAPAEKLRVIKNGMDFKAASSRRSARSLARELGLTSGPVVGTIARLHRQKGLVYLLRAVPDILRSHPACRIFIVGAGPLKRELEGESRRLGIENSVRWLGERPDAADILGVFDIFVLPSLWEGLPYVLGEAAHAGIPIIATDIDGVREVVRDGQNGLMVPRADPSALALAVNLLLEDSSLRRSLAARARKSVLKHFDLGLMLSLTETLYRELKTTYNHHP